LAEGIGEGGNTSTSEESPAKELTLDEWKALRANRQKPTFNIRKAGEGEDPSQWKKMYELNKKKEGEEEEEEDEVHSFDLSTTPGELQSHLV
jgi:plasminogen activator inhibitor 1 RNA-binding protein